MNMPSDADCIQGDPLEAIVNLLLALSTVENVQQPIVPASEEKRRKVRGYVYLFHLSTKVFKIGCSKNPDDRLKTGKTWVHEALLVHSIATNDMFRLESELHSRFAEKNVSGELFILTEADVAFIVTLPEQLEYKPGQKTVLDGQG